jgi:hypothetical protein
MPCAEYNVGELTTKFTLGCLPPPIPDHLIVFLQVGNHDLRLAIVDHHQRAHRTVDVPTTILHATLRDLSLPHGHLVRVVNTVEPTGAHQELRLCAILRVVHCPVEQALEK